jgi:hypothetical protein
MDETDAAWASSLDALRDLWAQRWGDSWVDLTSCAADPFWGAVWERLEDARVIKAHTFHDTNNALVRAAKLKSQWK